MTSLKDLELRDLRYFLEIARQGHMTRAARALHVAQPTLSHALGRLELELEEPLFLRPAEGRPGLRLTDMGRLLLQHTERILAELSNLQNDLDARSGELRGQVTLASMQTLNSTLLPRPLARFASMHPRVRLELRTLAAEDIPRALEEGRVDVGLLAGAPDAVVADLEVQALLQEELVLLTSSAGAWRRRRSVRLSELAEQTFVSTLPGTFTYGIVAAACRAAGFTPKSQLFLESGEAIVQVVAAGHGISILPQGYSKSASTEVRTLSLRDPTPMRTVLAAWSGRYPLSRAAREVLQAIQSSVR
jgi:DNA-binding transcriptional LysR family regulator